MIFLPWMTADNSTQSEPDPSWRTIFTYGFFGIFGAGWVKNTNLFFGNPKFFQDSGIRG